MTVESKNWIPDIFDDLNLALDTFYMSQKKDVSWKKRTCGNPTLVIFYLGRNMWCSIMSNCVVPGVLPLAFLIVQVLLH